MERKTPAAYQGDGWKPREKSMGREIREGRIWSGFFSNSEYAPLKAVLLHIPDPGTPATDDVNLIQHLEPIDYRLLNRQLQILSETYEQLGISVFHIKPENPSLPHYNLMYARDLFFMSPEGAVISRMASVVRAGEERHAAKALAGLGIPIARTIGGRGTLEGADAFWVGQNNVLVGTGNRTNRKGFEQLKSLLEFSGVQTIQIPLREGSMHLMGVFQIMDKDLAMIRKNMVSREVAAILEGLGFRLIKMDETDEITQNQAMNIVTIAPRKIVMVAGNPTARKIYEKNGIEIAAELEVSELVKGAGGLGCATGILKRELV